MADGELRLYCLKFASFTAFMADSDDGGSVIVVEKSPDSLLPDDIADEVKNAVLSCLAEKLACSPQEVTKLAVRTLIERLVPPPEKPRHPWLENRRAHSRGYQRSSRYTPR